MTARPVAVLYRMVMPDHVCPYGRKSLWLLRRKGFRGDDRHLKTRAAGFLTATSIRSPNWARAC